jgi:hypothetical protein
MSRFDKAELEGVIESMEKLLQEETTAPPATSGPAAGPSVQGQSSDDPADVLNGLAKVPESVGA